ncbi:hypothetical protein PENTCL1PPCAC_16845, partial [Pristionchus entomophagus]
NSIDTIGIVDALEGRNALVSRRDERHTLTIHGDLEIKATEISRSNTIRLHLLVSQRTRADPIVALRVVSTLGGLLALTSERRLDNTVSINKHLSIGATDTVLVHLNLTRR